MSLIEFQPFLKLKVTNLLDIEEKPLYTKINGISQYRSTYIISHIICPYCKEPIEINKHWNAYFCECKDHCKKVFEIAEVIIPDEILQLL